MILQSLKIVSPLLFLICLLIEPSTADAPSSPQRDPKDVERLKKMFDGSQKLALDSLYELNVLKMLKDRFNAHSGASINPKGKLEVDEKTMTIHRDTKGGNNTEYQISTRSHDAKLDGSGTIAETDDIIVEEPKPDQPVDLSKNDARQSSLFPNFRLPAAPTFPTNLGSNSLFNNLMRPPTLPSLPAFPITPKPPPPPPAPKGSLIGNAGGPMALTNDNVVVVNVLSGYL